MSDYFRKSAKNVIDQIKYRGTIVTGEITKDNGDGTYNVKIANANVAFPNVETVLYGETFAVGEIVMIGNEYGSKEAPKIIGHAKKIAQNPVKVEVDYGEYITVTTLDAYSITATNAYVEGKINLSGGMGNCTRRGFKYGLTTAYGSDIHEDGSYGAGYFNKQITGLIPNTTYHFQAYVLDINGDEQVGEDKTMVINKFVGLISCDIDTLKIYLHSGISVTILNSFASPNGQPEGIAYNGTNLISCDVNDSKIYIHNKISAAILSSFASPGTYSRGLTFAGGNLISCDDDTDKIYVHNGISSAILSSFASPSSKPRGLTYDGTNLISCDIAVYPNPSTIYIHSGISATISSSFTMPSKSRIEGLAFDGTNLISCCVNQNKIYIHNGISAGILSSFASPGDWPTGLLYIP